MSCQTCNDHGWTDQHGLRCFECGKSELDDVTLAAIEVFGVDRAFPAPSTEKQQ